MTRRVRRKGAALRGGLGLLAALASCGEPVVDTAAPLLTLDEPAAHAWVQTRHVTIRGTVTDQVDPQPLLRARLGTTDLAVLRLETTPGHFAIELDLAAGPSELTLEARDASGNVATLPLTLEVGSPLAAGLGHSGALTSGVATTWGANQCGQLGRPGVGALAFPGELALKTVTSLVFPTAGAASLAVDAQGQVWGWGEGFAATPAALPGLSGIVQLAAGIGHRLALRTDGTVFSWGENAAGQLGRGSATADVTPTAIPGLGGIVAVCAGAEHSVAVRQDGAVLVWGKNDAGQLGQGTADAAAHPAPVAIEPLRDITAVGCGRDHTLARRSDGTVWAWGLGSSGQLGHGGSGNQGSRPQPTPVGELRPGSCAGR